MNNFRRRSLGKDYIIQSYNTVQYIGRQDSWSASPTTSACTLVSGKTVKLNSDISFTLPYLKRTSRINVYASGKREETLVSVENKTATGKFLSGNLTFIYDNSNNGCYKITKAIPSNLVNSEPFGISVSTDKYKVLFSLYSTPEGTNLIGDFIGRNFKINVSGSGIPTNVTSAFDDIYSGFTAQEV